MLQSNVVYERIAAEDFYKVNPKTETEREIELLTNLIEPLKVGEGYKFLIPNLETTTTTKWKRRLYSATKRIWKRDTSYRFINNAYQDEQGSAWFNVLREE